MPSTSVHIPSDLLDALDRLAAEQGVPRNRIIVEAVRDTIARQERRWPTGFFANDHLTEDDLRALREGECAFIDDIHASRRSRSTPPFA